MDSVLTDTKLELVFKESAYPDCDLVIPETGERCYSFSDILPEFSVPDVVISTSFFKVGVYVPFHPFIRDVHEFYDLAPLQLTPNSYRLAINTYILYASTHTSPLIGPELGLF